MSDRSSTARCTRCSMSTGSSSPKGSLGLLSDAVTLFGYHKRSYFFICSLFGSASVIILAILPTTSSTLGMVAVILFTSINLQVAAVDLLSEAVYAKLMVSRTETDSDLVSFAQWSYA